MNEQFLELVSEIYDIPNIKSCELINERNGPRQFYRKIEDDNYSQKYKINSDGEYYCIIVHTNERSNISNKSTNHRILARASVYNNMEMLKSKYNLRCPKVLTVKNAVINKSIIAKEGEYHCLYGTKAVELCDWIPNLECYSKSNHAFISTVEFASRVSDAFDSIPTNMNDRVAKKLKPAILYNYTHNNVSFDKFLDNTYVTDYVEKERISNYQKMLDDCFREIKDNKDILLSMQLVISHSDLYTGNIGYLNDSATYLYDFEDLRYGLRFEDILRIYCELCVNNYSFESGTDFTENFKLFADIYNIKDRFTSDLKRVFPTLIVIKILYEIHFAMGLVSAGDSINYYDNSVLYLKDWIARGDILFKNIQAIREIIDR